MEVKMVRVSDLKPYPKNAKKHPAEQITHVANSIQRFGWQQPLVIDGKNNIVIGHCRLLAAKELKQIEVPCVVADTLTEEEAKSLRLADNKTNESEWDFDLLGVELDGIFDIDMSQFGFGNLDLIDANLEADRAGASPWERMGGSAQDGVLFQFGDITCRLPSSIYDDFNMALGDNEVTEWVAQKISSLF